MIINKTAPFYTAEDYNALALLSEREESIVNQLQQSPLNTDALTNELEDLYFKRGEIEHSVEERYWLSFKGNTEAIIADAREIIDAITKEDYFKYHERAKAQIEPILKDFAPPEKGDKVRKELQRRLKAELVRGYNNCRNFLFMHVTSQLNALFYYHAPDTEIRELIENKAESYYKKPQKTRAPEPQISKTYPVLRTRAGFILTPTSPFLEGVFNILSSNGSKEAYQEKHNRYSHSQLMDIKTTAQGKIRLSLKSNNTSLTVELDDITTLTKSDSATEKLLVRIIQAAADQAIREGELASEWVEFPLIDLVGKRQYKNLETARLGFKRSASILQGLKTGGEITKGKQVLKTRQAVLFPTMEIDKATCRIRLNRDAHWGAVFAYFTGLPDYYFELPDRAATLLRELFITARQQTDSIKNKGFFTVSYRALQTWLGLPLETETKNPKRDIKDEIKKAVNEIMGAARENTPPAPEGAQIFHIDRIEDTLAPIKEYLNTGKLQIWLGEYYSERFISISRKREAHIETEKERQERRETAALAKVIERSQKKKEKT